jgi:large subunit ribosomal protein L10
MTRKDKAQIVSDLTAKFKETDHFYITDTSGLTVGQVNKFRGMCFTKGVEYKMVKNTLIKKALENVDGDFSSLDEVLKGTSGIMFVNETANIPAKIIKEFQKSDPKDRPKFKAASVDSDLYIGEDQLGALVSLKSKQELIGDVIALLQSPAKNVISALSSGGDKLAGIVKTLSEREN